MSLLAWSGLASGIVLAVTGIGLALAGPRRPGSRFFSLFLIAWAAEIALFNLLELSAAVRGEALVWGVILGLVLVEALFLVYFIVRFSGADRTNHRWWTHLAATYVLLMAAGFVLWPGAFFEGGRFTELAALLAFLPNFAALYIALHVLADRYLSLSGELKVRETAIVAVALSLYASYTAAFFLTFYGLGWLALDRLDVTTGAYLTLFAAASLLLAVTVARLLPSPEPPRTVSMDRWILAGVVVPFVLGVVTGAPSRLTDVRVDLFGVLRVLAGGLIAYGVLKYDLFDIDLKVKAGLRQGLVVSAFVVAFFVVSETVEALISDAAGNWAGLAGAGLVTLGLRPLEERASQIVDRIMPGVDGSEAYVETRKTQLYQAAVERAMGDQVLTDREKRILSGLREELGLAHEEAHAIEERILSQPVTL